MRSMILLHHTYLPTRLHHGESFKVLLSMLNNLICLINKMINDKIHNNLNIHRLRSCKWAEFNLIENSNLKYKKKKKIKK